MEKIYAGFGLRDQSADAEWWEKTSAQGWLRFMEVARRFSLPASFESLLFSEQRFPTIPSFIVWIERLTRQGIQG